MNMQLREGGAVHAVPFGVRDTDAKVTACGRTAETVFLILADVTCKSCLKIAPFGTDLTVTPGGVKLLPGGTVPLPRSVPVSDEDAELLRRAPLPRRNPEVAVIPIDDEVIGSVRHVDIRPRAWIVNAAQAVADATSWVCRSRIKPTRVSRRRAQRLAMAR